MRKAFLAEVATILCLLIGSLGSAQAQSGTNTFDELGNGVWANGAVTNGFMLPDPGPSGTNALTYFLPFQGVIGDVVLTDVVQETSDCIRFNGNGTLVFYSNPYPDGAEPGYLADVVFPALLYTNNLLFVPEVGSEQYNYAVYKPTLGQPGYDPSNPIYMLISDVPEPGTVMLVGLSLVGLLAFCRRRK